MNKKKQYQKMDKFNRPNRIFKKVERQRLTEEELDEEMEEVDGYYSVPLPTNYNCIPSNGRESCNYN